MQHDLLLIAAKNNFFCLASRIMMKDKSFYTIGELSKMVNIPITTLRYYNKIKLLSPSYVEPLSSYRYYSTDQLFIVSIIKELKLFAFSLNEIKEFLKRDNLPRMIKLYQKYMAGAEKYHTQPNCSKRASG
jgi:DNA-binding transcriptional MerR regulator